MKKTVSIILTLCLLCSLVPICASAESAQSILNRATLNPDHFLAEGSDSYYYEFEQGYMFSMLLPTEFYPEDADRMIVDTIAKQTKPSMSTYEKVITLYDFIINTTSYEYGGYGNYCSVYSVLVEHIGTCVDYNYVMMAFLRYIGIDADLVSGQTTKAGGGYTGHSWAEAYINGTTYVFDPQIDDNIAKGGPIYHYRFCKTYNEVAGCYIPDRIVGFASAESDNMYYIYVEDGSTLHDFGIDEIDNTTFDFELGGNNFAGWYYDEEWKKPINEYAPIHSNLLLWAGEGAAPFVDVLVNTVFAESVRWAVDSGITAGIDAKHFMPYSNCTRAQVVTFLWRAKGCPEPAATNNPFSDVSAKQANGKDNPYYKAILWAAEEGITTGYAGGLFKPNDTVTRAQFVTFLWRADGKPATSGSINGFADAASIATPYQQAVAWAVEKGITTGYNDGTFRPNAACTRWAVVLFMYRDMT